jgi:hypothetical protein
MTVVDSGNKQITAILHVRKHDVWKLIKVKHLKHQYNWSSPFLLVL